MSKHQESAGAKEPCFKLTPDAETAVERYLNKPEAELLNRSITMVEYTALLRALERGQGDFTQTEANNIEKWAERVRLESQLLELLIEGAVNARFDAERGLVFVATNETDVPANATNPVRRP